VPAGTPSITKWPCASVVLEWPDHAFPCVDSNALGKQTQLNAALDLDKHEAQVVAEISEPSEKAPGFVGRVQAEGREAPMAP
jgi:hypothetical protein